MESPSFNRCGLKGCKLREWAAWLSMRSLLTGNAVVCALVWPIALFVMNRSTVRGGAVTGNVWCRASFTTWTPFCVVAAAAQLVIVEIYDDGSPGCRQPSHGRIRAYLTSSASLLRHCNSSSNIRGVRACCLLVGTTLRRRGWLPRRCPRTTYQYSVSDSLLCRWYHHSSTLIYLCVLGFFCSDRWAHWYYFFFFLNSTSVLPQHVSKDGTKRHIDLGLGLLWTQCEKFNQSIKVSYPGYERGRLCKRIYDMPTCLVSPGLGPVLICLAILKLRGPERWRKWQHNLGAASCVEVYK